MSIHLERDLESLKKNLLTMGAMVEDALRKAIAALIERNQQIADAVVHGDDVINHWEVEIEEACLKMLALHQPVAGDLRFIAAVMKINNDLERIGDHAVNIAERATRLIAMGPMPVPPLLKPMADNVSGMVRGSLDAFVNRDARAAQKIRDEDNVVDEQNRQIIADMHNAMRADATMIDQASSQLAVSQDLERVADLATNIAEDVIYLVEGQIIRHRSYSAS